MESIMKLVAGWVSYLVIPLVCIIISAMAIYRANEGKNEARRQLVEAQNLIEGYRIIANENAYKVKLASALAQEFDIKNKDKIRELHNQNPLTDEDARKAAIEAGRIIGAIQP